MQDQQMDSIEENIIADLLKDNENKEEKEEKCQEVNIILDPGNDEKEEKCQEEDIIQDPGNEEKE